MNSKKFSYNGRFDKNGIEEICDRSVRNTLRSGSNGVGLGNKEMLPMSALPTKFHPTDTFYVAGCLLAPEGGDIVLIEEDDKPGWRVIGGGLKKERDGNPVVIGVNALKNAVMREIKEEVKIEVNESQIDLGCFVKVIGDQGENHYKVFFLVRLGAGSENEPEPQREEHIVRYDWFNAYELPKKEMNPTHFSAVLFIRNNAPKGTFERPEANKPPVNIFELIEEYKKVA